MSVHTFALVSSDFPDGELDQIAEPVPAITQEVLDSGAVLGFAATETGTRWVALPFIIATSGSTTMLNYAIEPGTFIAQASSTAGFTFLFVGMRVRVVVIENASAAGKRGVDLTDYEQVARYYRLSP